ncbi:MAG: KamA family radical SAM protein [Lentisphaeria bacterium]|nr:KamA family radical SAM protein [Lentisphaeria bacterium]
MSFLIDSCDEMCRFAGIKNTFSQEVESRYPVLANSYYLALADTDDCDDPISKQIFPSPEELEDEESSYDPLAENRQMPVPRLIHRFDDRAVLLSTSRCAVHCRFCFRKRFWTTDQEDLCDITDEELARITDHLKKTPQIKEVLISGGDPLMLGLPRLKEIISAVSEVGSILTIRVGTRIPVVMPELVSDELAQYFGSVPGLWVLTHFNHAREVTPQSLEACGKFIRNGVPVLNQTVLLKGVNDTPQAMEELFRTLIRHRIKPHYMFHVDPVRGVRHFSTGIEKGLEILRYFRSRLSSLAIPTFAIDLPEGGGKVHLQPDYSTEEGFTDIHGEKVIRYEG